MPDRQLQNTTSPENTQIKLADSLNVFDTGSLANGVTVPVKKRLELYGATSHIFGDKDAGFSNGHELLFGSNHYWFDSWNVRTNIQVLSVNRSPVGSVFGFYVGGQKGPTVSVATSFYF